MRALRLQWLLTCASMTVLASVGGEYALDKRVDGQLDEYTRFYFPDDSCTPRQKNSINYGSDYVLHFALAGRQAVIARRHQIAKSGDVYYPFFYSHLEDENHVLEVMEAIKDRARIEYALPAPTPEDQTPIICVPDEEATHCKATSAYTPMGYTLRNFENEEKDAPYKGAIYLCPPALTPEFLGRELKDRCSEGTDDDSLTPTITNVIFKFLVYLVANEGEIREIAQGASESQRLVHPSAAADDGTIFKGDMDFPLRNSDSYVFYAYLAWKAKWDTDLGAASVIVRCLQGVFPFGSNIPSVPSGLLLSAKR